MIKTFSLVLDLLKVCLCVKLESNVLQDLLCKRPRVDASSSCVAPPPPPPSSSGDPTADAYVDLTAIVVPLPSTSDDSDIRHMLETVMTIQATDGQLLVDMLNELRSLQADLESLRQSPPPPPFDDE